MTQQPPFVFATRHSERKFWERVADAIQDGWPYYHVATNGYWCVVCMLHTKLGFVIEDKIIVLMEKTNA